MINKNSLHYYVDLLRKQKEEKQTRQNTESCISALHNIICCAKIKL